jgi:hypothetical protein
MSPSVAQPAVQLEGQSVLEVAEAEAAATATEVHARCIRPPVPSAANRLKYRFNLVATNRFTAETAIPPNPNNTQLI